MPLLVVRNEQFNRPATGMVLPRPRHAVRISLLLYFYAVLHKLNHNYFNPNISCSNFLLSGYHERFAFMPDTIGSCEIPARKIHHHSLGLYT